MSNTETTDNTDSDFDAKVAESVAKLLQAQQGLSPSARRCLSCWGWSRQISQSGTCTERCSFEAPNPDRCLARRLRFGGQGSTIFYSGLCYALSIHAKVPVEDILNEEKYSDDDIATFYDTFSKTQDVPRRPPTKTELALSNQIQEDTRKRDRRRTLISQKKSVEDQIQRLSTRLASLDAEIEDLPEAE